jgi:hypothetical protein
MKMLSRPRLYVTRVLSAIASMAALASAVVLLRSPLGASAERIAETIRSQGGTNIFGSDLIELVRAVVQQSESTRLATFLAATSVMLQAAVFWIRERGQGRPNN